MIKPWTILSTKIIHHTPWIELKEETCEVDGRSVTYTYTRRRDQGPTIIAEEADGRLWFVQQYRHPIKKVIWQFPSEGKQPEEAWEAAAQRGLNEEMNLHAHELIDLGESYVDPGGLEQVTHYFLARNLEPKDFNYQPAGSEVEDLQRKAFTPDEIKELIKKGEICDNWTFAGLYLYNQFKVA